MKYFLAILLMLAGLLTTAQAQQLADDKFLAVHALIETADHAASVGQTQTALAGYTEAQVQLEKFNRLFPNWNSTIVNYRRSYITGKIAELKGQLPAVKIAPPAATPAATEADKLRAQLDELNSQIQTAQTENTTLQAKLKEALTAQPATADPAELARAQEQIRTLMKENELLKATPAATGKNVSADTNASAPVLPENANDTGKLAAERDRAEKLAAENEKLRSDLDTAAKSAEALTALNLQNAELKAQLAALQTAAAKTTSVTPPPATEPAPANNDQLAALNQQNAELKAQIAKLEKIATTVPSDEVAALNDQIKTLQARLTVSEAKPLPYSAEELALLRQPAPAPQKPEPTTAKSIKELPADSAELVASAQLHFAHREFKQAEADYLKILERDPNNNLVLANLATIELQQNNLVEAEKHITAAVAQSPEDAYNLSTLGYLKFRQEKYDDALNALSHAAQVDPKNPEIQNYLGVALSHKGQRKAAETALRKAIELNPAYAPAHNNLAVIYLNQEPPQPQLARWHYQKALQNGQPPNPDLEKILAEKGAPVTP